MLIPSNLIDSDGNLLSHIGLNFESLDDQGYPAVIPANNYQVCHSAPKMAKLGNHSASVAITSAGGLYDLFKRTLISIPILGDAKVITVFDLRRSNFDFALLDSRGRLIEVVNYRSSCQYRLVAEGVKLVVPHQSSSYYAFVDRDGKWQAKRPYVKGVSPIIGELQPKLDEVISISPGFIYTKTGMIGLVNVIVNDNVNFQLLGDNIRAATQHNAMINQQWITITHIMKSDGTVHYRIGNDNWSQKTFKIPVKFIRMRQIDIYTLLIDDNQEVYLLNRRTNQFNKLAGLKGRF